MAKKRRRPNLSESTLERARAELYGNGGAVAAASPTAERKVEASKPILRTKTSVSIDDLREEYSYVLTDLRNMLLLTVFLFVALIAAALIFV
ncbi:MAG: hypothetical protein K8I82_06125 [Anaerolineae bacterium]|nr:hypothetical protein [Anaerolineae bacterium]